jgi:MFS family permease
MNISFINLVLFFGYSMMMPIMPIYIKSIGGNDSHVGLVVAVYTIASLVIRPFAGLALDRLNRKKVFFIGLALIAICMSLYGLFSAIWMVLLLRILDGVGFGIASTGSVTIASDLIPQERFGEGMGFFALTNCFGMVIAPVLGFALMNGVGFNLMTIIAAGLIVISLFLTFFIKQSKAPVKIEDKRKFRPYEKSAIPSSIVVFFVGAVVGSVMSFISLYASSVGIENVGLFFTFLAGALLVTRPIIGKMVDRFGFDVLIFPGFALLIIAMIVLSFANTLPLFLISGVVIGTGYGATQTSLQTMAVINAPRERRGAANATFFTGIDGGVGVGSLIAGMIAAAWGYKLMYLSLTIFILFGAVFYFIIARQGRTAGTALQKIPF